MQRLLDNPAGTKIAKRAAKVRGVDPAGLYFHGGELTRAARHRQHRRMAFAEAMALRHFTTHPMNQLIDNATLVA